MKQRCKRRDFLGRVSLGALSVAALGACSGRETPQTGTDPTPGGGEPLPGSGDSDLQERTFNAELDKNRTMPRDLVNKMLDQKVDEYMQRSHHCAQSAFMALKEQFALDGEQVFRALTPLPGIAERGETCGAVTGPLMALGLIYGRDIHQMDDWDRYQASLLPAGNFCEQFEQEFGTTLCHEVQEGEFGRCYRLTDPKELQEFQNAGATEKCSAVVRSAVRMAAGVILEDDGLGG
jgi:C_GCAxxG_C_C family probable redox protein